MNSGICALIILSLIVGTLANYGAAPAKYETPKGGYGGDYGGGYAAPAPKSGGYGGSAGYGAPMVHTYAAKAPSPKCGSNILISCAPTVAHVPCNPSGGYGGHGESGGYGGHGY